MKGKAAKRRMNAKAGQINLTLVPEFVTSTKSILQLLKEQLTGDNQSPWKGSEVLYVVMIFNRKRGGSKQAVPAAPGTSKPNSTERYLILMKKPESTRAASLLKVFRKEEDDLEVKNTYEVAELKSLDYGSEDTELILSTESSDYSVHFNNQGDRDETLWIIMQVYKAMCGKELNIGYSVDMDALSYLIANSGLLGRFPQLQKIVNLSESQMSEHFTTDELEAEQVLDEINWGSSFGAQKDLHQILSQKSDKLNNEIIDFLLQWEEMDEVASQDKNNNGRPSGKRQSILDGAQNISFGLRDTREVLRALSQVDTELYAVDCWLGEQISKLSKIKANLHMIEDESGALETSWQNLNVVQDVITFLIEKYSIKDSDEKLLRSPDSVINSIFKSTSFANIDLIVEPLIQAGVRLRNALVMKVSDMHGLTSLEWKQIQAITAIKEQKSKLGAIATEFTTNFNQTALNIFEMILKHRVLQEGEAVGSTKVHTHVSTILPKNFTTKAILEELSYSTIWVDISKYFNRKTNQLLDCQHLYQNYVVKFAPLIDLQIELLYHSTRSQNIEQPIRDAYVRATHERFYAPLLKAFTKDIQSLVTLKHVPISFSTVGRYRINGKNDPTVFFNQANNKAGQSKLITSWKSFEVALMLIAPLIVMEEHFIKTVFHLDGRQRDDGGEVSNSQNLSMTIDEATFLHSKLHFMLDAIFDEPLNRLLSITSSQSGALSNLNNATHLIAQHDQHDGIESIAMLASLTQFATTYMELVQTAEQNESLAMYASSSLYLAKIFKSLKAALEQNIHAYTLEQINWINSQRGDPKAPGVLLPFTKFPTMVMQITQMTNGLQFESVDDLLMKLCKELLSWLSTVAKQNEKYVDKVKLVNLIFFQLTIPALNVPILQSFVTYVNQQIQESTSKYVHWMVEYEFPSLSALAIRLDGVGKKVSDEDLSLYIRRKDVLNVIKELESKTLDSMVSSLAKRLEKHFKSEFDGELRLMSKMWNQIKERMVNILKKLETAASISYQIQLDVSPKDLIDLFDKYAHSLQSL